MEVATVLGLGLQWIQRVRDWLSRRSEHRKRILEEANRVLSQDPEELARVYVEPDLQAFNPANLEDDEPDEEDDHFRIPAYKWLDSFLIKPRRRDGSHVVFILSDAGMGKSSLLAMLRMTEALDGAWPGIQFKLFKLGAETIQEIERIANPSETVLLLDSLDEDPEAFGQVEQRLVQLLNATELFRQVIITCRTQFFPRQSAFERHGGRIKIKGFSCKMIFLALFSEAQISGYLKKVFPADDPEISQARRLIASMKSLRMRPMLLAYVEDLMEARQHHDITEWTPYRVHSILVAAWLSREERKKGSIVRAEDLRAGCHVMAIHLQEIGERTIDSLSLADLLRRAGVKASIQKVEEFGGRSLLNLNSDGEYRFAHYSIQEFLVVDYMSRHPEKMAEISSKIRYSDELVAFLVNWTLEAGEEWRASLQGAYLRGAVIRGAKLVDADLNGASLREADCRAIDLTRAHLSGADLSGANLSDADLSKADLSGVDLRRAILINANLEGVKLEGANLRGTNLRASKGLVQAQLNSARGDSETLIPAELRWPEYWQPVTRFEPEVSRQRRAKQKRGRKR